MNTSIILIGIILVIEFFASIGEAKNLLKDAPKHFFKNGFPGKLEILDFMKKYDLRTPFKTKSVVALVTMIIVSGYLFVDGGVVHTILASSIIFLVISLISTVFTLNFFERGIEKRRLGGE